MKGRLLFQEEQYFRDTWGWGVVILIFTGLKGFLLYGFYSVLTENISWEERPDKDIGVLLAGMCIFLALIALYWMFYTMHLKVKIDRGSIRYAFYPFFGERTVKSRDLDDLYFKKRTSLSERGFEYRIGYNKTKSFAIAGKTGIQLALKNGEQVYLGTQKPLELEIAIQKLKQQQ